MVSSPLCSQVLQAPDLSYEVGMEGSWELQSGLEDELEDELEGEVEGEDGQQDWRRKTGAGFAPAYCQLSLLSSLS